MCSVTWIKIPVEKIRSGVTLWNIVFGEKSRSKTAYGAKLWDVKNSRPVKTPLLVGVHPSLPSIPPNASPADPADKLMYQPPIDGQRQEMSLLLGTQQ
jgi:hypothetical protein